MPRYLVIDHSPGVTAEDFQKSVPAVLEGKHATFVQSYANLVNGTIVNIYDGASDAAVGRELERIGFPYDEIQEVQFSASHADLSRMAGKVVVSAGAVRPAPGRWFGKGGDPVGDRPRSPGVPEKEPRKVNIFEHMTAHQGMLEQLPLFPWFGPGDIVPTAALSLTLPETPRLHFYHYNDVPEVILCMAAEGGLIATGQLYLQQGTHGVTTFLRQPTGPEGRHYQIAFVIIRMKAEGPQNEGFILRCFKCNEIVFRMDRDIWGAPAQSHVPELPNIRFYADAADAYNAEPRSCSQCSAVQPRFPSELVGWRRYAQYIDLANRARRDMEAAWPVTPVR